MLIKGQTRKYKKRTIVYDEERSLHGGKNVAMMIRLRPRCGMS